MYWLRWIILLAVAVIVFCATIGPVRALQQDGPVLTLTAEEHEKCKSEGGCFVLTMGQLEKAVGLAIERMRDETRPIDIASCWVRKS